MTARVRWTLIAVTIASVAVHTNATISESPIATSLHTEGGPFLGSRLLPDIWTSPASPLVISEARRLTANPVAYAEASRLTVHPVAFSEVLLSWLCRLLLRRVLTHSGARLLRGASPHGGPFACSEAPRLTVVPVAYSKARLLQGITTS